MSLPTNTIVELGDQVTDPITGFKGTAVAITHWLTGCRRVHIQPKGLNKDGECFASQCFDEPTLKVTRRANTPKAVTKTRLEKGGPRPTLRKHR